MFKVNPLIMTLGMGSVLLGVITVGLVGDGFLSGSTYILPLVRSISSGTIFGPLPANLLVLGHRRHGAHPGSRAHGPRPLHLRNR